MAFAPWCLTMLVPLSSFVGFSQQPLNGQNAGTRVLGHPGHVNAVALVAFVLKAGPVAVLP